MRTHGMRVIGYYTVLVVTFFNTLQQQPWETLDRLVGQNVPKKVASYFEPVGHKIKNSSEAIECTRYNITSSIFSFGPNR